MLLLNYLFFSGRLADPHFFIFSILSFSGTRRLLIYLFLCRRPCWRSLIYLFFSGQTYLNALIYLFFSSPGAGTMLIYLFFPGGLADPHFFHFPFSHFSGTRRLLIYLFFCGGILLNLFSSFFILRNGICSSGYSDELNRPPLV